MYMLKYALKRIGLMLLTFFIIMTMCFVFVKLLPNEPPQLPDKDMAIIEERREMLGYNKSTPEQYFIFLFGRTAYTFDVYDANGNPVQARDRYGDLMWETRELTDEEGHTLYKQDEQGNYLDRDNNIVINELYYVPLTEQILDENGNPIPIYATDTVYEKSEIPSGVKYTTHGVGGIIRGEFGVSEVLFIGLDVWDVFIKKVPYTVVLNLCSIIVSIPIGLALGIYAALRKNKWQDHVISTGVMIFVSVPSFIYAFLVQYLLYFKLGLSAPTANATNGAFSWTFISSIFPAVLSMCFGTVAGFARYTRAELTEVLTSEFMLLARTKGLSKSQAVVRHALKNAMVVIFPMILGEFISIMSGSLIIEQMFTIPGVGDLYINSIQTQPTPDYNFFMLLTIFYTFIGLAAGIVIDISYGIIDPRIRMGAK